MIGQTTIENNPFTVKDDSNINSPKKIFDENYILRELKHYLPSQTPLKDFIHHNTLHAFQNMKFYDAIFKASKIFGYQVTLELNDYRKLYHSGRISEKILNKIIEQKFGKSLFDEWKNNLLTTQYDESKLPKVNKLRKNWKSEYAIDLDTKVQPLLFRILSSYLDQGIASWEFPISELGFIDSIRNLEKNSFSSFFKTKRAKNLLKDEHCKVETLLEIIVGDPLLYEQYLFDQQFSHRGWSGMVAAVESNVDCLLNPKFITLRDLIFFELLLEIDALDYQFGIGWKPLSKMVTVKHEHLLKDVSLNELDQVFTIWQDAFEWSYYDNVLSGIVSCKDISNELKITPSFQAIFCIDERECSFRRNLELIDKDCETFGSPGFFGVEFYFQPENGKFYDKLCPAPVTPKYLIKEYKVKDKRKHELLYSSQSNTLFIGFFITITLGFWAGIRMIQNIFKPKMSPAISNAFTHMTKNSLLTIENKNVEDIENGLQIGFTIVEMANRVESLLRSIGLITDFSPIVYAIAHGSSSANNPHHGAHDCGACSGRPGSVNAKVFATMANHLEVRKLLKVRGLHIPEDTQFIGGLHDTASDEIEYYDLEILTQQNSLNHNINLDKIEKSLDLNAKERSRRFASIKTKDKLSNVRKAIKARSVSLFEPRPELGHGTNSLCIVGRRNLTKNIFLDRRAFLNSYDYKTDLEGKLLSIIMKPLGPVCGGINLEYYFSRMDNHKLGAGTKVPHNVMGLIGVANGSDGDLLPGLPLQMIEVHDPVRLLLIVEHFPEVVLKTIKDVPEMYEWFINDWVHLVAMNPETRRFYYFKEGTFSEYVPLNSDIKKITDLDALIESSKEMETNYIVDATEENLPIYII